MSTPNEAQIKKFSPIDGTFYLVNTKEGRLLAKCFNKEDADLIAAAPELLAAMEDIVKRWESGDLAAAVRRGAAMAKKARGEA